MTAIIAKLIKSQQREKFGENGWLRSIAWPRHIMDDSGIDYYGNSLSHDQNNMSFYVIM